MNMIDELANTLKKRGHSLTKSRKIVFSSLQSGKPRSMQDLVLDLSSVVDRATIYRNIDLFLKLGVVKRIQYGWKYKIELSDKFSSHHHHIHCYNCGITDSFIEPTEINKILNKIAIQTGYKITDHTIDLEGLCPKCKLLKDISS